jgi:hypothetical protein
MTLATDLRDSMDSEMSTIVGASYDALSDEIKASLFTAIGNACDTNQASWVIPGGGPDYHRVVLTADQEVSTTAATPTALIMNLTTGIRYRFRIIGRYITDGTTIGARASLSASTGALTFFSWETMWNYNNAGGRYRRANDNPATQIGPNSGPGTTESLTFFCEGVVKWNATANITFMFASETGAAVTLQEGSYIEWGKLDDIA